MVYSVNFANYTIGETAYEAVAEVCRPFGKRIFLIGGKLAMQAGKEKLESQIKGSELSIVREEVFGEECTYARMDELAEEAKASEADMIFGMGGGKALDTAKGTAEKAGLPVFTFPTIAATCAATTALSVVYREDGNFDSFYFFEKPARHSFIDTQIIAASVRNPIHVIDCALAGADIATVPYNVLMQMVKHPLTDQGIEKFKKDYIAVFGE